MVEGEARDGSHEVGHWLSAGYGRLASGATRPILWDLDTTAIPETWLMHELPLPAGDEGGENASVRKRPGRVTYSGIVLKGGTSPTAGIWEDNPASGWLLLEAADYLANPAVGTPIEPAGFDALGRIAVTLALPSPTTSRNSIAQTGTVAALLTPSPATAVDERRSTPRRIALAASPNPFSHGVRIVYTLPRDASVRVTVHDVSGRVVSRLDESQVLEAGVEKVVFWDGMSRNGERTAPGVYFVRVETPRQAATIKIVREATR
jgi:hypothetical protein